MGYFERRTDFGGVCVCPFHWERAALVGFDGVDAAARLIVEPDAGAVGRVAEHERLAVWRELGFVRDEVGFGHPEERGDAGDLLRVYAADSVRDPAARPAAFADKLFLHGRYYTKMRTVCGKS